MFAFIPSCSKSSGIIGAVDAPLHFASCRLLRRRLSLYHLPGFLYSQYNKINMGGRRDVSFKLSQNGGMFISFLWKKSYGFLNPFAVVPEIRTPGA